MIYEASIVDQNYQYIYNSSSTGMALKIIYMLHFEVWRSLFTVNIVIQITTLNNQNKKIKTAWNNLGILFICFYKVVKALVLKLVV